MCRVSARIGRGTPLPGDAMIHWLTMDVFDGLATLEDGSVDLVVTSPPAYTRFIGEQFLSVKVVDGV